MDKQLMVAIIIAQNDAVEQAGIFDFYESDVTALIINAYALHFYSQIYDMTMDL